MLLSQTGQASASLDDFEHIIEKIEPILVGEQKTHALMALLTIIFLVQYPQISEDDLATGIEGTSEYVANFLEGLVGLTAPLQPGESAN